MTFPIRTPHHAPLIESGQPGSWSLDVVPFEDDGRAMDLVESHPDGMTTAEIADAMGIEMETVRLIEHRALQKMRSLMADAA